MQLVVLANEETKQELLAQGLEGHLHVEWISNAGEFANYHGADGYMDLLYDYSAERQALLKQLPPTKPVLINAVQGTLNGLPGNFVRFNGWPGFLQRPLFEATAAPSFKTATETIVTGFRKKISWVSDVPGFIAARVVAMIINEAWFALSEGVSTKEETDIAMKSGTNYPYGPFEWGKRIGLENIHGLLRELSITEARYTPSQLLESEVKQ